jgi:uncharacterized membrane protein YccC
MKTPGVTLLLRLKVPPTWLYATRTTLAAILALYVAFLLQLDNAYSAPVTALIVANPMHGMVWSKSLYRLAGTLAGAIAALVLMANFAQTPELFVLGLGIWMGACTAVATLLRNFRSYGAVLAGYTVALVAIPAVDDPLSIFDRVLDRGSLVVIGIICSALVSSLFSPRMAERSLQAKLLETIADLGRYCSLALDPEEDGRRLAALRPKVGGGIQLVNNLIEFAATERPELSGIAETLGVSINAMLGAVSAATSVHAALSSHAETNEDASALLPLIAEARRLSQRITEVAQGRQPDALLQAVAALKIALTELDDRIEENLPAAEAMVLVALDRLDDMVAELVLSIDGLARLLRRDTVDLGVRARFHLDWRGALVNGTRAAIAVWAACFFWNASAWPSGGAMVLAMVPAVGLFANRDTPEQDSLGFAWGSIVATVLAVLYLTLLLPAITSFAGLALALAPAIFIATVVTTNPRYIFAGVGFSVFFITEVAPSNPMVFDLVSTLNNGAGLALGSLLTAVVYRLVLPVNPRVRIRTMIRIIIDDVAALARLTRPYTREAWESRMHDRMMRMRALLQISGMAQENLMHGAFAAFRLGREILRMRSILDGQPVPADAAAVAHRALEAVEKVQSEPVEAAGSCREAASALRGMAAERSPRVAAAYSRAAGSFLEMALLIDRHRRFFQWGAAS